MQKRLLRSKMILFGDTCKDLANDLGIAPNTFSAKLNRKNGAEFSQQELDFLRKRYRLSDAEFVEIFFACEVS